MPGFLQFLQKDAVIIFETNKCQAESYSFLVKRVYFFLLQFLILWLAQVNAQRSVIEGTVKSKDGVILEFATIYLPNTASGTTTNNHGFYRVEVPPGKVYIRVSHLGYVTINREISVVPGEVTIIDFLLEPTLTDLPDFKIVEKQAMSSDVVRLDPKLVGVLPGPTGGVEGLIRLLPGVSASSELSSQYSVRGGNFDENLVYVEDIEIYRPLLISAGQQEGLSFLNPDLTESITFSTGGFEARYGDKLSSVLDIQYRRPERFGGGFSVSLLEGSLHLDALLPNKKTSIIAGMRYKSNQYLLGTLQTKGEYNPFFYDVQALAQHTFSQKLKVSLLANYNHSSFNFKPETRTTRFGTIQDVKQFTVFFYGQEVDKFRTALGALSLNYTPNQSTNLRFTSSIFQTDESETFDIGGAYWLQRVETDFGSDDFNQPVGEPLGVGGFLNHARNRLNAIVWNFEHAGSAKIKKNTLRWGAKFQKEDIIDKLEEWTKVDSAGYVIPLQPNGEIVLQDVLFARISLQTERAAGFLQNTTELQTCIGRLFITAGLRFNHWSYNNQLLVSPRTTILFKPSKTPQWTFRLSGGWYSQPPFYRELRNLQGQLNPNARAQESFQLVLGSELNFIAWQRPFRLTSELYYKNLSHLIPYNIQDVKIRYLADYATKGYAYGIDLRLSGEFVPGTDSWASLSLMRTEEIFKDLNLQSNLPQGYVPRPTDQRMNFNLFFQDYLPNNPSFKVQVGFIYNTGLPFGPPTNDKFRNALRMEMYRRIDVGFSKQLVGEGSRKHKSALFRSLKNLWVTLEIFNVVDFSNTMSYSWIKDTNNFYYAVPNRLTGRLINLELVAKF